MVCSIPALLCQLFPVLWLQHLCTLVSAVSCCFYCSIPALSCQLFPVLWLQNLCTLMSAVSCCFDCSIPALFQLFPSRHYPFAVSAVFLTAVVVHSFHCLTFSEMTLLKSLFTVLFFCCSRFYKNLHCHHRSKDGVSQASIHCLYVQYCLGNICECQEGEKGDSITRNIALFLSIWNW